MATLTASLTDPTVRLNASLLESEMNEVVNTREAAGKGEKLPTKREEKPPDVKEKDGDADSGGTDASNAKRAQAREIK